MTTPLVLTPFLPSSDTTSICLDIDAADCTLTRDVVRVALTALSPQTATPNPTTSAHGASESAGDAECNHDRDRDTPHRIASVWTGTPLRAIVPLPRRKRASATPNSDNAVALEAPHPHPCVSRAHWDDPAETDSEEEGARESVKDGDADDAEASGPRYCSYESITAAEGLSCYSFEELRVECYAQSLIARGARPPPVERSSLAIPPAFTPRIISQI